MELPRLGLESPAGRRRGGRWGLPIGWGGSPKSIAPSASRQRERPDDGHMVRQAAKGTVLLSELVRSIEMEPSEGRATEDMIEVHSHVHEPGCRPAQQSFLVPLVV